MEKNDRVEIRILRDVVNRVFDFIEKELERPEVDIKNNFYWTIADDVLYSMGDRPRELDCGSLIDDWEFVLSAYKSPDRSLPATLLHIAPLLRALATTVPSYKVQKPK